MKPKKIRKPRRKKFNDNTESYIMADCDEVCVAVKRERDLLDAYYFFDLESAKKLHAWLGKWLEWREGK